MPKQLARFHWQSTAQGAQTVEVSAEALPLCTLSVDRPGPLVPAPIHVPVLSQREDELLAFSCTGTGGVGMSRGLVRVPANSPFSSFGITSGRQFFINDFDVRLPTPLMLTG